MQGTGVVGGGWVGDGGLGLSAKKGRKTSMNCLRTGLEELTEWIESVCVGASRVGVCPELVSRPLLVRLQVRH